MESEVGQVNIDRALVERMVETFKDNLKTVSDLIESGFMRPGDRLGLGTILEDQSFDVPVEQVIRENWMSFNEQERQEILKGVGELIGLNLANLDPPVARRYKVRGVRGTPVEAGAEAMAFATHYPELEFHILDYHNPKIGRRYELVVRGKGD